MKSYRCQWDQHGLFTFHCADCPRVGEEIVSGPHDHEFNPWPLVTRWRVFRVQHLDRLGTQLYVEPWLSEEKAKIRELKEQG